MKILVITNLYPNALEPTRGAYNRQQILALSKFASLKVVAPVPWSLPLKMIKKWYHASQVPRQETIDGFEVFHPRYFMTPKIGRSFYGVFFFISIVPAVLKIYRTFKFDALYVPWAYPDGVGAYFISRVVKKPIVIGLLGTDINEYLKYFIRRKFILHSLRNSQGIIAVSRKLKDKVVERGIDPDKVKVLYNGVNRSIFKPMEKSSCREKLGLSANEKIVLFIGNLVPVKGIPFLLEAFSLARQRGMDAKLVIIGDGTLRSDLESKARSLHLEDSVHFTGIQPHDRIALWMNASDLLCLPSINEGCPNVVLESLSCGIPVVASNVGGIPELIEDRKQGILVEPANAEMLAAAITETLQKSWDKDTIARSSTIMSWDENAGIVASMLNPLTTLNKG